LGVLGCLGILGCLGSDAEPRRANEITTELLHENQAVPTLQVCPLADTWSATV